MKLKNTQDFTYKGYLHNAWHDKHEVDEQEIYPICHQSSLLAGPATGLMPMFFVVDYTKKNYLVFTESIKNILGYDARDLLDGGVGFTLHIAQKDFFKTVDEKVFPATLRLLQTIPQHEHGNYVFSYNNQFRNSEGQFINKLQKGTYITSKDTGMLLYCIGMVMDINAYKRDTVILHQVEKIDPVTKIFLTVETNFFYPYDEDTLLTKQEKNIIKYIADGLSSKMIAFKLRVSENTIANHRKNMMRKTNTQNVAHLIAFAIKNGII